MNTEDAQDSAPEAPEEQTDELNEVDADPCLALVAAHAAIDKKAENLKILEVSKISGFTDYFVICSAMSERQIHAISDSIRVEMKKAGGELISAEGYQDARWVLMDYGDMVVHIFLDAIRDYYDLEGLWEDAIPVKIPSEFYGSAADRLN